MKSGFLGFEVGVVGIEVDYDEVVVEPFEAVFNIADGVEPANGVGENIGRLCFFVD